MRLNILAFGRKAYHNGGRILKMSLKSQNNQDSVYAIKMKEKGAPCPPTDRTLTLTCSERGRRSRCEYRLGLLGADTEPRGVSLLATALPNGVPSSLPKKFVVKVPDLVPFESLPDNDRKQSVNEYLRQFEDQVRCEQEIVARLEGRPVVQLLPGDSMNAVHELELTIDRNPRKVRVFLRQWIEGKSLKELCEDEAKTFRGISIPIWFQIAEKLIVMVHNVHLAGSPHGYICPTNIFVAGHPDLKKSPLSDLKFLLINFERDLPDPTLHMNDEERKNPTFSWRRRYDSPERTCFVRPRASLPTPPDPFVPGDLYSLGLTLLYLATGEPISPVHDEEPWRDDLPWQVAKNQPFRKSDIAIKKEVWDKVFKARQSDDYDAKVAAVEIIFACLRLTQHRFFNARAILEVYRQCAPHRESSATPQTEPKEPNFRQTSPAPTITVMDALQMLNRAIDNDARVNNSVVSNLYRIRLNRALLPFSEEDPTYRRYTVGTRPEIVDALVTLFTEAGKQGYTKCTALTTATFFSDENCSSGGRVFSSILRAVARGAKINWLFILDESRMNHPSVIQILGYQKRAMHRDREAQLKGRQEIKFAPKGPAQYRKFLRENESFLYLEAGDGSKRKAVLAVPDYSAEPGTIIALRVFPVTSDPNDPIQQKSVRLNRVFDAEWKRAYPLVDYPHRFPA